MSNIRVGYARVSTTEQNIQTQIDLLKGCDRIYIEKLSGKGVKRPELDECLSRLTNGDTLVITRLDRLGRSTTDLINIIQDLRRLGVGFECIQQPVFNIEAGEKIRPEQQLMLTMMSAFAEFETEIRKERQADGIAAAKEKGVYKGRKTKLTNKDIIKALERHSGNKTKAAKDLGITYHGLLKRFKAISGKEVKITFNNFANGNSSFHGQDLPYKENDATARH